MTRELTPEEYLQLAEVIRRVGPEPKSPKTCPKCGSNNLMLFFGAGLWGQCDWGCCACGWGQREDKVAWVRKIRAACKPVFQSFNPPVEQCGDEDLV